MSGPVRVNVIAPSGDVVRAVRSTDEAGCNILDMQVHLAQPRCEEDLAAWVQPYLDGGNVSEFDPVCRGRLVFVSDAVPRAELAKAVGLIVDHGGVLPLTISPVLPTSALLEKDSLT